MTSERSALEPQVPLYEHAIRLHRLAPDDPLPDGGRPYPDPEIAYVASRRERQKALQPVLKDFLMKHEHVNSLFKVNNGYDFLAEMVFQHIKDLEDFLEMLEHKYDVKDKSVFYIIEDICREEFMAKPELVKLVPAISE